MALVGGQVDSHPMALRGHATESVLPTDRVWEGGGDDWRVTRQEMASSRAGAAGGWRKVMTHDNLKNLR